MGVSGCTADCVSRREAVVRALGMGTAALSLWECPRSGSVVWREVQPPAVVRAKSTHLSAGELGASLEPPGM